MNIFDLKFSACVSYINWLSCTLFRSSSNSILPLKYLIGAFPSTGRAMLNCIMSPCKGTL